MMGDASACPSENELQDLLGGRLPLARCEAITRHMGRCSGCRGAVATAAPPTQPEPSAPPLHLVPPRTLSQGRYLILELLGSGAMGSVYRARDLRLTREVAIKLLFRGGPEFQRSEAIAMGQTGNHNNVAIVYDFVQEGDRWYFVMEYVKGTPLHKLKKPIRWQKVLRIALEMAAGLAACHERGITHRDVKPSNAVLTAEGTVKLIDFGLARLTVEAYRSLAESDHEGSSVPPELLIKPARGSGTPLYMPPEAWDGMPTLFYGDVYSLGVVLYELCSGALPHVGATLKELERQVTGGRFVPLAQRMAGQRKDIDRAFAALIDRCLDSDPSRRPANGGKLLAEFRSLPAVKALAGVEPPLEAEARPAHGPRSGRSLLRIGAVAALCLGLLFASPCVRPPPLAEPQPQRLDGGATPRHQAVAEAPAPVLPPGAPLAPPPGAPPAPRRPASPPGAPPAPRRPASPPGAPPAPRRPVSPRPAKGERPAAPAAAAALPGRPTAEAAPELAAPEAAQPVPQGAAQPKAPISAGAPPARAASAPPAGLANPEERPPGRNDAKQLLPAE